MQPKYYVGCADDHHFLENETERGSRIVVRVENMKRWKAVISEEEIAQGFIVRLLLV